MSGVRGILDAIERGLVFVLSAALSIVSIVLVLLVSYQVLSRIGSLLPIWHATEELARGFLIWLVMLGAALGVRNQEHFSLQLASVVNSRHFRAIRAVCAVLILFIAVVFVIYGWEFLLTGFRRRSLTTGLPAAWSYSALFVSGCFMLVFAAKNLFVLATEPRAEVPPSASTM